MLKETLVTTYRYYYIVWKEKSFGIFFRIANCFRQSGLEAVYKQVKKEYVALSTSYEKWIKKYEKESLLTRRLSYLPKISVIVVSHDTPYKYLDKMFRSVIAQTYHNWELCFVDNAIVDDKLLRLIDRYAKRHTRVRICRMERQESYAKALRHGVSMASGDFVVFLEAVDTLAPNAFFEVASLLNENRKLSLIYSDEDMIDGSDDRHMPHFKSGWNPDMFFSTNYLSALVAIRRSSIEKAGSVREGFEGKEQYDLILRLLRHIEENQIAHIEKILYHRRSSFLSAKCADEDMDGTLHSGVRAVQSFFDESGSDTVVLEGLIPGTYKPVYPIKGMQTETLVKPWCTTPYNRSVYEKLSQKSGVVQNDRPPLVSLLIPTRDGYDILHKCIDSILEKTTYPNYEIIVLDNETTCPRTLAYMEEISRYDHIRIVEYHYPFNYSAINNFGVEHAKGELIGFINNDVEVITEHWLTEMVQHAVRPEIGAVGAMLYYDNDTIQHAGVALGIGGVAGHLHKGFERGSEGYFARLKLIQNYSAVTAACMIVRKKRFLEVGGFDEVNLPVAFNDVDLCLKLMENGYRNLWTPYVELYHHESVSRGEDKGPEKEERFAKEIAYMQRRWRHYIERDPYYNINLTREREDFSLSVRE